MTRYDPYPEHPLAGVPQEVLDAVTEELRTAGTTVSIRAGKVSHPQDPGHMSSEDLSLLIEYEALEPVAHAVLAKAISTGFEQHPETRTSGDVEVLGPGVIRAGKVINHDGVNYYASDEDVVAVPRADLDAVLHTLLYEENWQEAEDAAGRIRKAME